MIGGRWSRHRPVDGDRTVLVNHWYSHAVGHVIEALRRCQGYHACDPTLRASLVLNHASPVELARCASFVADVFAVPYTSFGRPEGNARAALRRIPRDWDYVLHHPAVADPNEAQFEGLQKYYAAARRHFRARVAEGVVGRPPPAYQPHQSLRLELPDDTRSRAREELGDRLALAVMPAGSGARHLYPSITSWLLVLDALEHRFPGAAIVFIGRLRAEGGRTVSGISRPEVDRLVASRARAVDAFDRPILDQLALVERSSLFLSPHTGFGFAAVAVDTPWLTLSGGDWHEHFFNGVPFYSVLPKSREYPAFVRGAALPMIESDVDGEGRRTATMSVRRIRDDLEELVEASGLLVERRLPYEQALAGYFPRLLDAYGGDRSKISSFESVDDAFV